MITVNPPSDTLDAALIEAYRKVAPTNLGHVLESGMGPEIRPVWRPVKLVGPALTVQTTPDVTTAIREALDVARPGDVLVVNRAGDLRHGFAGEFAALSYMERGVAGLVTNGLVSDVVALERMKFPVFCYGVSTAVVRPLGEGRQPEGAVNVPIQVGGVVVSPGDLIMADDDGVMVASPQEARDHLAYCQEMEAWESYARGQLASGRTLSDILHEREGFRKRFHSKLRGSSPS
jgi:regulator of RNase E activity RraA